MQYRFPEDRVIVQESVISTRHEWPGGRVSYYGNRLNKFRYIGPRNGGGIYDAFHDYQVINRLDPAKYRYRW